MKEKKTYICPVIALLILSAVLLPPNIHFLPSTESLTCSEAGEILIISKWSSHSCSTSSVRNYSYKKKKKFPMNH